MPLRVNKPNPSSHKRTNSADRLRQLSSNQAYSILDSPLLNHRTAELNSPVSFQRSSRPQIEKCAFCDDPEPSILLSCSHQCHQQCLLSSIDDTNLSKFPSCSICNKLTRCLDDSIHDALCSQKYISGASIPESVESALSMFAAPSAICSNKTTPITPRDQIIPDTLIDPPVVRSKQLLSPDASFSYNKQLYEDILKPQVQLITSTEQVTVSDTDHELQCLLSIKPPKIYSAPAPTEDENKVRAKVATEFKALLGDLLPGSNEMELLLVDAFKVSDDAESWTQAYCFLFDKCVLMVDRNFTCILGNHSVNKDFTIVGRSKSTLILSTPDGTEVLQMNHAHVFAANKWNHYLSKLMRSESEICPPLFQFTSSCWQLARETKTFLPSDILKFQDIIDRDGDISSDLFVRAIPQPEPMPLCLVLSVCLVNNVSPPVSHYEYKLRIVKLLNTVRSLLRPSDKLGLIFVGVDGSSSNDIYNLGSFTGCVEPWWSGWESVIDLIEVLPNRNINCEPIFSNGLEELLVSFEKCKSLSPFIPSGEEYNNKFLILQANSYGFADDSDSVSVLKNFDSGPISRLCEKIDSLKQCSSLTFDLVRVGSNYNAETKICNKLLSKPRFLQRTDISSVYSSRNLMEITVGNSFLRFDTFEDLTQSLELVVSNYHSTSIPSVNVDLYKFPNFDSRIVQFSEIEINGTFYSILNKNLFGIQLNINSLLSKATEKNILMKIRLNSKHLDPQPLKVAIDKCFELPLFNYQTQWLDKHDEYKAVAIKIANREAIPNHFSFHAIELTPPSYHDKQPLYKQTPLLPPLSSFRDRLLAKRRTELAVFQSIRMINEQCLLLEVLTIINYSIELITKLGKELSIDNEFNHDYLNTQQSVSLNNRASIQILNSDMSSGCETSRDYIQFLTEQLMFIQNLFDKENPMALTKCQDLANLLM